MIKAYIFDAFGTLFNLDNRLLEHINHPSKGDILNYARSKQLSYTWLQSLMQTYQPFDQITRLALEDGCKKYAAPTDLATTLSALYFEPIIFDDVLPTLQKLQKKSKITGILSNGTHQMLRSGIQKNGLESYLNVVYSVDDIGQYKPTPEVYQMVTNGLKIQAKEVLFVSSNQWDVAGAANYGFQVAWLNRNDAFRETITMKDNVREIGSAFEVL